ncbi:MAG: pectic acid lyase, partial [Planctomycetaceae bacterium]|nr:pectic acid lyase [Planctomycetaceae bacterium]
MSIRVSLLVIASQLLACCAIAQDGGPTRDETLAAMRRAAEYYHEQVALNGGYVYYYSLDLKTRLGEGAATPTQIWVQPPGTPTVGLAYLSAYEATGDEYYLHAATHAAEALMFGQLKSGCWMHAIDFDSKGNRSGQYRNGKGRGKNYSTFDDNSSQSALLFMMKCDQAHKFNNAKIHESAM